MSYDSLLLKRETKARILVKIDAMSSAKKVILNTGISYGRMILSIGISLYSTRLVLNALGSTDYGIFNLVAGIIAMLSFLNTAMATSTQRYLSFHQGSNDLGMQKRIFANSVILHILIGVVIVCLLEISAFFLFDGFLKIPSERLDMAKSVFHFMGATVFFTVLSVPFVALLNAHENMIVIALINIVEVLLKLGIAIFLSVTVLDKLGVYGILTGLISVVTTLLYIVYCAKRYKECRLDGIFNIDKGLVVKLLSFAGWNLFGTICFLGRTQGLAIMLNVFFGAVVNASYGIANQVAGQMNFFSVTMLQALNPQIMKSEGSNNRNRMLRLCMIASKFSFFLLAFIAVPCIIEMPYILAFWLKKVPDYSVVFCRLTLLGFLFNQLTIGMQSGLQAIGRIKQYQAFVGMLILSNLPLAYILLMNGYPAPSVLITYVIIEVFACCLRLFFIKKEGGLILKDYFLNVIARIIIPLVSIIAVSLLITYSMDFNFRFVFNILLSAVSFGISIYFTGLCSDEKELINNLLVQKIGQFLNKKIATTS